MKALLRHHTINKSSIVKEYSMAREMFLIYCQMLKKLQNSKSTMHIFLLKNFTHLFKERKKVPVPVILASSISLFPQFPIPYMQYVCD